VRYGMLGESDELGKERGGGIKAKLTRR
jgi:hypothetical protein